LAEELDKPIYISKHLNYNLPGLWEQLAAIVERLETSAYASQLFDGYIFAHSGHIGHGGIGHGYFCPFWSYWAWWDWARV
jgi:hypothetical protein